MIKLQQEQRLKELRLLQSVTQKMNSILDLNLLLEEIVGEVLQTFGYCRSAVLLKDEKSNELEIAAVRGWTRNFHTKGDRFKIGEYGITGHVAETGRTYYAPNVKIDPYYQISEESTNSELDVPLKVRGKLIGVFNIQDERLDAFSNERITMLETLAANISIAIENARLFQKERLENEKMQNELSEARKIQMNLFPKSFPAVIGFNITGVSNPCLEVGGDWYDFIPLADEKIGIVLADVSGKGMGAALLMSSTRSILRLIADSKESPKDVLRKVNEILVKDFPSTKFVTMIYGILDPKDQTFVFANAGHLYPLYIDGSKKTFLETSTGFPLGVVESDFTECSLKFSKGSRLIFYTDGITEAMNECAEEFGDERLRDHFNNSSATVRTILDEVNNFSNGYPICDDVTLVMIKKN